MKTNQIINIFFIITLLTSNMISCSSKMRKSNTQTKIENTQVPVTPSTNSQSTQPTQNTNSSTSTIIQGNDLSDQLKAIETPSSTKVDTSLKCSAKFENIISKLPDSIRNVVINEFKANTNQTTCCKTESMIKSVSKALKEHQSKFTKLMSDQSSIGKKGLACVRAPDVVISKMKQNPDSNGTSQQKSIIDQLLKNTNQLNSDLSKCLVQVNKIMIKNLGLMCGDDSFINVFFNIDSNGKVTSPKKSQENEINLYNSCSDYIKNYSNYASTILSSYTDSLNFLLGNEKCNYFSNNFKFDPKADKDDPLFPANVKNAPTNSVDSLLESWNENIRKIEGIKDTLIAQLKRDFLTAQKTQPNGLSTYIGRYDINYDIIKRTFYLDKYPAFHVQCRNKQCIAFCPQCNGLSWDSNKVVSNANTNLDVACVNNICLVLVSIFDNISGRQTIVPGAEIFLIRGNDNLKEFDSLTLAKVRNSAKCFTPSQTSSSFVQTNQNTNSTVTTSTNSTITNNSTYVESKIPFSDAVFKTNLANIIKDPSQYQQDFNLATALKLKVTINGVVKRLEEYIYNTLYKTNYSFYLACEKSVCTVQCDSCDKSILTLSANSDTDLESPSEVSKVSMRSTGGGKSSSSSGSKSSSSGSKSSSSSSSSGGSKSGSSGSSSSGSKSSSSSSSSSSNNSAPSSSGTTKSSSASSSTNGGFSSGSSSTSTSGPSTQSSKGGSNLTNNNSQAPSPASKGGSALTAGTSYSSPATTSTSSYVSSNTNSNPSFAKPQTVNNGFSPAYNSGAYSSGSSASYSYNSANSYPQTSTKSYYYNYNMNNYQPTTKVKVKIYDFTPSYGASYSYYPYSSYGGSYYYPRYSYYSSYGVYGYDPYYYRPYNPYIVNTNTSNRIYLSNEFNPSDWSPSSGTFVTKNDYMKIINNQLQNVKISVECCKLFCVTYVDSIQDNMPNKDNKKRVYLDVTLRGLAFINSSTLTLPQGKCLIKNTLAAYSSSSSSSGSSQGLYSKCGLPEPFDIVPIKRNCAYNMVSHCANNNFGQLVNRITSTITSSDEKGSACTAPLNCINLPETPSEDQKKSCGDALYGLLLDSGAKINYSSLVIPCSKSTTSPSSFIQKEMTRQNLLNSSAYVNLNALSASQKQAYDSIGSQVSSNADSSIVIDNSSPSQVYNSSTESQSINSSIDDIVKVSVKNSGTWVKTSMSWILILVLILI